MEQSQKKVWNSIPPIFQQSYVWRLISLVLFLALFLSKLVWATVLIPIPDQAFIEYANAIIIGKVEEIQSYQEESSQAIYTLVTLSLDEVLKGVVSTKTLVLKQGGGIAGNRRSVIYGSPTFTKGEKVLVFLSKNADGTPRVAHLALGKFSVALDPQTGQEMLFQLDLSKEAYVLQRKSDQLIPFADAHPQPRELEAFKEQIFKQLHTQATREPSSSALTFLSPQLTANEVLEDQTKFDAVSFSSRWFEPDEGEPVEVFMNANGQPGASGLGFDIIRQAFEAWSNVEGANFRFKDGGFTTAEGDGSDGITNISFGDPLNIMEDPVGCGGLLASAGINQPWPLQTRIVNNQEFIRIIEGDILFNNGWEDCSFYSNDAKFAEVATHELGHILGLGHSQNFHATMRSFPHFDDRGALLKADDIAGLQHIYPAQALLPPTALTPSGLVDPLNSMPTYSWEAVPGATWYKLWVNASTGNVTQQWVRAAAVGCSDGAGICSISTKVVLPGGEGTWWVRGWSSVLGVSPWSSPLTFTIPGAATVPPFVPLPLSPSGTTSNDRLTYSWNAVVGAMAYKLWVNDSTGNVIQQWVRAAAAGCSDGTGICSISPEITLATGEGTWWVRAWNSVGSSTWSSPTRFTIHGTTEFPSPLPIPHL